MVGAQSSLVADVLVRYMKLRDMTQVQLADALGVKQQSVSKWFRGDTSPTIDHAVTAMRLLEVPAIEMIDALGLGDVLEEACREMRPDRRRRLAIAAAEREAAAALAEAEQRASSRRRPSRGGRAAK